jgi:hypothetical protein
VSLRTFIGRRLRYAADRIDYAGAPRASHITFTFEEYIGIVFREDGRGCRVWHLNDADYERAHTEAGPVANPSADVWLPDRRRRDAPGVGAVARFMVGRH